jgi:hypothetical protein
LPARGRRWQSTAATVRLTRAAIVAIDGVAAGAAAAAQHQAQRLVDGARRGQRQHQVALERGGQVQLGQRAGAGADRRRVRRRLGRGAAADPLDQHRRRR